MISAKDSAEYDHTQLPVHFFMCEAGMCWVTSTANIDGNINQIVQGKRREKGEQPVNR